jgi:hypothetical protein
MQRDFEQNKWGQSQIPVDLNPNRLWPLKLCIARARFGSAAGRQSATPPR